MPPPVQSHAHAQNVGCGDRLEPGGISRVPAGRSDTTHLVRDEVDVAYLTSRYVAVRTVPSAFFFIMAAQQPCCHGQQQQQPGPSKMACFVDLHAQ